MAIYSEGIHRDRWHSVQSRCLQQVLDTRVIAPIPVSVDANDRTLIGNTEHEITIRLGHIGEAKDVMQQGKGVRVVTLLTVKRLGFALSDQPLNIHHACYLEVLLRCKAGMANYFDWIATRTAFHAANPLSGGW